MIESCNFYNVITSGLNPEKSNNSNTKDIESNRSRTNNLLSCQSLGQESSSSKFPKTSSAFKSTQNKSVCKTREGSTDKEHKLFKTKTLANLNNFSSTAKNLKYENKSFSKTPTNSNKTTLFNSEKETSTTNDSLSKNKTFVLEPNLKRDKTNTNLLNKDESFCNI